MAIEEEQYNFNCEKCNYHTNTERYFKQHKKSKKHKRNYENEEKVCNKEDKNKKYHCIFCDYYTNSSSSYSQHKNRKKHKRNKEKKEKEHKYKCSKCDFMTNDDDLYYEHYKNTHVTKDTFKQYYNNQQQTITNSNNVINNKNIYNIHLNYDKETFKLMLNEMSNDKFIELLGGNVKDKKDFCEKEMWNQDKISNMLLENIVNKSIENKEINESIKDIKINNSDLKYNQIKLKDKNEKFITYDVNSLLTDTLKNNIVLTKEEHKQRLTDDTYLLKMLFINEISNAIEFKKGYRYDYNSIIKDILLYSIDSLEKIKNKDNDIDEDLELKRIKKNILNTTKKHFNNFKEKLKRTVDNQ